MNASTARRTRSELPLGYRLSVASRVVAAAIGGYTLATLLALLLSKFVPLPRGEAVMTALLISFAIYTVAIIWVFAVRTATQAWRDMAMANLVCAVAWWLLGRSP